MCSVHSSNIYRWKQCLGLQFMVLLTDTHSKCQMQILGVYFVFFLFLFFRQIQPWGENTVWVCLEHAKALGCSDVVFDLDFFLFVHKLKWHHTTLSHLGHPPDPPTFQCFLTAVTALTQNTSQISTNEFKHLDPFWVQPSDQPLHQPSYTTRFHPCHMLAANQDPSCTLQALGTELSP